MEHNVAETVGIYPKRVSLSQRILRAYVERGIQAGFEPKETMA